MNLTADRKALILRGLRHAIEWNNSLIEAHTGETWDRPSDDDRQLIAGWNSQNQEYRELIRSLRPTTKE